MFDFTQDDASKYLDDYIIPFAIDLAMAIIIFIIGKIVVKMLVSVLGKLLSKAKYDDMLVEFLKSIANAILMLFVIVASLGLAILAFQLTSGLNDSDSSNELQEAMPALQQ